MTSSLHSTSRERGRASLYIYIHNMIYVRSNANARVTSGRTRPSHTAFSKVDLSGYCGGSYFLQEAHGRTDGHHAVPAARSSGHSLYSAWFRKLKAMQDDVVPHEIHGVGRVFNLHVDHSRFARVESPLKSVW